MLDEPAGRRSSQFREKMMSNRAQYAPGPARPAQVRKGGERWTLILARDLRHPPEKVWHAITDPEHLHEWAPFDVDGDLTREGATVKLIWTGTSQATEAKVTKADRPSVLEYGDMRWELNAFAGGTRLKLWHVIDHRFVSWGAAGWHISFDVLDRLLAGEPIGRIAGADAMKIGDWQGLVAEYKKQFEEAPDEPAQPA